MALIAEFSVPTSSFALGSALDELPGVAVEAGQIVAHSPDTTMPCLWVAGGDTDVVREALERDPTLDAVQATIEYDEDTLFHVEWSDEVESFVQDVVDHEGAVLAASADADRWHLRFRFATREQFDTFRDHFADSGRRMRLERLFQPELPTDEQGELSPQQYRALATASEMGYFEVPRGASLREVAEELGVSHQAVSERLRRGTGNVVRDVLLQDVGPNGP